MLSKIAKQDSKRSSFEAFKVETLASLDEGFDSLRFLHRFGQSHMIGANFRALMKVYNDYLWAKTTIERALRMYTRISVFSRDKQLLRDVLTELYQYVIGSVTRLLIADCISCIECPQKAAAELRCVVRILFRSVQRISDDDCLLTSPYAVVNARRNVAARPKEADVQFAVFAKGVRDELALRRKMYSSS